LKVDIKNPNISSIHAYTFEAIHKGSYTKKVIENFDHLEKIPHGFFANSTFHIGIYDYTVRLSRWKITDVKSTIEGIERDNKNILNNHEIRILKDAITAITVTVSEQEFLPYNFIILHFELKSEKIGLTNTYRRLSRLLKPLENYWLTFDGRFSSDYKNKFSIPSFFQIRYDVKIKTELNNIFDNLEKHSKKLDVKKYVESCDELKKHFLLENLNDESISLLKVQDNFYILGSISSSGGDFATVFSLEPSESTYTGTNPFFSINPFFGSFPSLFLPYLLLVSPIFWVRTSREKITEYLTTINQLKVEYKTEDYLKSEHSKQFSQVFNLDNGLNFLSSELNDLQTMNKIFNNYFLKNPEIIDKSIILERYEKDKEDSFICNNIFSS